MSRPGRHRIRLWAGMAVGLALLFWPTAAQADAPLVPVVPVPAKPGAGPAAGSTVLESRPVAVALPVAPKGASLGGGADPATWTPPELSFAPGAVPIVMYHEIGQGAGELYIPEDVFRRQMDYLVERGYHTISFPMLLAHLQDGAPLPPKPILLTFDDGYASIFTRVAPILEERGLTATFFIDTGQVGTSGRVAWDELRDLVRRGFAVGSHTVTHRELTTLTADPATLMVELTASRQALVTRAGAAEVTVLCYPVGRYDATVVAAARVAGYQAAVTTVWGRARPGDDPLLLPRIRISQSDGYLGFTGIIGP